MPELPAYLPFEATAQEQSHTSAGVYHDPSPPAILKIGGVYTLPVVTPSELDTHLRLLAASDVLRETVYHAQGGEPPEPSARWAVFLARAVYRFEQWVTKVLGSAARADPSRLTDDELPPLDVAMVFHAYHLNPWAYHEDGLRMNPALLKLDAFPFRQLAALLDLETLPAATSRQSAFQLLTGQPFASPITTGAFETVFLRCPCCDDETWTEVHWLDANGNGYAQRLFKTRCRICFRDFNRDSMCVRKFAEDVQKWRQDKVNPANMIAGCVFDPHRGVPWDQAVALNQTLLQALATTSLRTRNASHLAGALKWRTDLIEDQLRLGVLGPSGARSSVQTPRRVKRILETYRTPGPFSINLANAVMRQSKFIEKMTQLGWTKSDFLNSEIGKESLHRAIARYHAFFDLMASAPTEPLVPTLDIDLCWHTHQLHSKSYRSKSLEILNRIPDHDDKISDGTLSNLYARTAKRWETTYGVPYSSCGCIIPQQELRAESSGSKFKLFGARKKQQTEKATPGHSSAPLLPQISLSSSSRAHSATHPSEHPSIILANNPIYAAERTERRKAYAQKEKELRKAASKNKSKGKVIEPGSDLGHWSLEERHDSAFVSGLSSEIIPNFGQYGSGDCVVYAGGVVNAGRHAFGHCAIGTGDEGLCATGGRALTTPEVASSDDQRAYWGIGLPYKFVGFLEGPYHPTERDQTSGT